MTVVNALCIIKSALSLVYAVVYWGLFTVLFWMVTFLKSDATALNGNTLDE